ncbi:hypothetical protein GALMADRAFT_263657 [Galerina marginata CBS 339.88]|uniref:Peptidase S9 prolyl oligopeptidase catalytic domain-containing protein n=1 Tax=Galerina marginata (strain CBS 339.88) TaxID=685588 RepID=A0A067TQY6_GALM3|nr:hypothetical protein GALMADRAFT_263657 [Galerina marginata CBS 339.88]
MSDLAHLADRARWNVQFDDKWDVLGPFPIHAREQHFLSPAFPLNLSQPIDFRQSWPSSYVDGGFVKWTQAISNPNGDLEISFPEIRWKALRSTEGWAALQHHAVLRTTITLYPPTDLVFGDSPQLLISLKQGSYFALRPQGQDVSSFVPEWYAGNIYDLEHALAHVVYLPAVPSLNKPTKYDLFVSGDYEIRLFGDPLVQQHHSDVPVQKLNLTVRLQEIGSSPIHDQSQDVACDFLAGYAFGDAFGIGIQSGTRWWTAIDIKLNHPVLVILTPIFFSLLTLTIEQGMTLQLRTKVKIAPSQTRVLPISIEQSLPYFGENVAVNVTLVCGDSVHTISVIIPIIHRQLSTPERQSIKGTFFFANSTPSAFIAIPPRTSEHTEKAPPILTLHGAGVDVLVQEFWAQSLPDNKASWMIVPTGRTSWGLDWHGPSAEDAWSSSEAVGILSRKRIHGFPKSWEIPQNSKVIIIGHSNGGQGTWYLASRYPDRVLAAIPAAAYIKSQGYIPLTHARFPNSKAFRNAHFTDPTLRSILESSLTADDNDLHVSNLADTPLLVIHGGEDENVPVWHSREYVSTLRTWNASANVTFLEHRGEGHWYPYILDNSDVQNFIDNTAPSSDNTSKSEYLTLTVSIPRESGSLHGWSIDKLMVPGRYSEVLRTPGRMQSILSSPGPLIFVISEETNQQDLSVALRLAHVLNLYHKLDGEIISEETALTRNKLATWPTGNVIFLGTPSSPFAQEVLHSKKGGIRIINQAPHIGERRFDKPGQALLFLHPHPTMGLTNPSFMMFLLYNDKAGLERAARLFPFRTGVAVPDWLVVGDKMDMFGAGGLEAAGVWDSDWKLSEYMSWFYR